MQCGLDKRQSAVEDGVEGTISLRKLLRAWRARLKILERYACHLQKLYLIVTGLNETV